MAFAHALLTGVGQSSDPCVGAVAPHGGIAPLITPNPIAAGLPASGDPILIDVSTSITRMGYAKQQLDAGLKLPGPWLIDAAGNATDDPAVAWTEPEGALLPLGDLDAFRRQMDFVAESARRTKPRRGVERVLLPGEGGLRR